MYAGYALDPPPDAVPQSASRKITAAGPDSAWIDQEIRPGIRLLAFLGPRQSEGEAPLRYTYDPAASPVQFFYCLTGEARIRIERPAGRGKGGTGKTRKPGKHKAEGDNLVTAHRYAVSYAPGARATTILPWAGPLRMIVLLASPESLRALAADAGRICPSGRECEGACRACVREVAAGLVERAFHQEETLPLPLEMTLKQILDCPLLSPGLAQLFLEYKGLELFYNQLGLFDSSEEEKLKGLTPGELAAAHRAHDILLRDMAAPPSLLDLAKQVGLTHTRLNRLFRALHHDTVFGVFRRERLECARKLLADNRKSVTEVAYECGFSTPSHFSRSFLERYGIQPKRYQKGFARAAAAA